MSQETTAIPLTDLCAICHINPIKYTCPRDGIHTCSLPCVKRHKKWAQCSGVRDPAEYRKRSELATASSIDKDFNFITKLERSLSRADNVVADKGIELVPARLKLHDARSKLELDAASRDITIIKAPKGLSRSKQNKTHWSGQTKCVVWTVEWICQNGRKIMSGANETLIVKELFESAAGNRRNTKKRKRHSDVKEALRENTLKETTKTHLRSDHHGHGIGLATHPQKLDPLSQVAPSQGQQNCTPGEVDETLIQVVNHGPGMSSTLAEQHFYLHRPNTESRFKCVIPISPDAPLRDMLNKKTLVEFPTIYVRNEPPEGLKPPFITEDEYVRRHGEDIPINVVAPTEATADDVDLEEGEVAFLSDIPITIDETTVLEVLAKDLGG